MDFRMRQAYEAEALAEILGELDYYRLLQLPRGCAQADVEPAFLGTAPSAKMHTAF